MRPRKGPRVESTVKDGTPATAPRWRKYQLPSTITGFEKLLPLSRDARNSNFAFGAAGWRLSGCTASADAVWPMTTPKVPRGVTIPLLSNIANGLTGARARIQLLNP